MQLPLAVFAADQQKKQTKERRMFQIFEYIVSVYRNVLQNCYSFAENFISIFYFSLIRGKPLLVHNFYEV